MTMHPILVFDTARVLVIALTSWGTGWGVALLFQGPQWFEQPAVVAAMVSAVGVTLGLLLSRYFQKSDKKKDEEKAKESQHMTFSEKIAELASSKTETTYDELEKLHNKEITLLTRQYEWEISVLTEKLLNERKLLFIEKVSDFESRLRAHRLSDALQHLSGYVFSLHGEMNEKGVKFTKFKPKTNDEIMIGVAEEIEKFKSELDLQMNGNK